MKTTLGFLTGVALISLSGAVTAAPDKAVGQKIYDRAFGRGCGTCHDIKSNPQLTENIKAGSLDRAKFEQVIKNGRNAMPKAIDEVMNNSAVKKAGMSETDALDSLYEYIKTK